jgi:cytidylate kinase
MKPSVITIDGPAGAGKTTISKILADRLGYRYIDTGALYRGVAFEAKAKGVEPDDDAGLNELCATLDIKLVLNEKGLRLVSHDRDISDQIRTPEITMLASAVSARPVVREYLLGLQREMGRGKKVIFEGRDMGTVVFPEADVKFFLDASSKTRANRRYLESADDASQTLKAVQKDIKQRDNNDRSRALAPLKPAEDAIILDATNLSIEEVVGQILSIIDGSI